MTKQVNPLNQLTNIKRGYFTINKTEFKNLDMFGSMLTFKTNGISKFQTKTGSIITILLMSTIVTCLIYYLNRLRDKTTPIIQMNEYVSSEYADVDLVKDDMHFVVTARSDQTRGETMNYQKFSENFLLVGLEFDYGYETVNGKLKRKLDVKRHNFTDCNKHKWPQKILDSQIDRDIVNTSLCLEADSIHLFKKGANRHKTLSFALFPCLPTKTRKCKNDIPLTKLNMSFYSVVKSINITNYDKPISYILKYIYNEKYSGGLKFETRMDINTVELTTDKGMINQNNFMEYAWVPTPEHTLTVERKETNRNHRNDCGRKKYQ